MTLHRSIDVWMCPECGFHTDRNGWCEDYREHPEGDYPELVKQWFINEEALRSNQATNILGGRLLPGWHTAGPKKLAAMGVEVRHAMRAVICAMTEDDA